MNDIMIAQYRNRLQQFLLEHRLPYVSAKHLAFRTARTEEQILRNIDTMIDVDPESLIRFLMGGE